ncbi:hypothetical protein D1007_39842 [Hordeum vulgare]|nr:hypothetical protein D1007_39842 [Hordeum vulgare]
MGAIVAIIRDEKGPRLQESTVHYSTGDYVTILDSTVHDWASGAAVCIFSGRGSSFFSAVAERLSRQWQSYCEVGYVLSKMTAQLEDDVCISQKNMLALLTEPIVVDEDIGIDADGEEGNHDARKIVVDWNVVELNEKIDVVITPISDIDMAEMFGIQVDDKDKEKDDSSLPADGNTCPRNANEDEEELMRMAADDVDDTNDNELVCLYDKENPVIEVGKLWPSMVEFRMSFRTFVVKKEFEAKTMWTDRKKFFARCKGYDGGGNACKCYIFARLQRDGSIVRVNQIPHQHTCARTIKTIANEATVVLPCLEVVLPIVEHEKNETVTESALTPVLPCLEVVLPSVELQTEEVEQCVPSTQSAEVQTEEVGDGQVQKLRGRSGVVGKNTKSISINKQCAVEPNSGKKEKKSSGRKKQKK